nr:hypothetical protein Iba_chr11aCG19430 [Ipomoea batatas]
MLGVGKAAEQRKNCLAFSFGNLLHKAYRVQYPKLSCSAFFDSFPSLHISSHACYSCVGKQGHVASALNIRKQVPPKDLQLCSRPMIGMWRDEVLDIRGPKLNGDGSGFKKSNPTHFLKPPLCFSLNWAQPTREFPLLESPKRFWNGIGLGMLTKTRQRLEVFWVRGLRKMPDGNSRKSCEERMKSPKLKHGRGSKGVERFPNGIGYRGEIHRADSGSSKS